MSMVTMVHAPEAEEDVKEYSGLIMKRKWGNKEKVNFENPRW